jgi:hypothetical protein
MTMPITPLPREAAYHAPIGVHLQPRRGFGTPMPSPIDTFAVKDPALRRPVPADSAKFGLSSSGRGLFDPSASASTNSDSSGSPTLFSNPTLVSNTVSPQALFGNSLHTHTMSSAAPSSASPAANKMDLNDSFASSLNTVSGTTLLASFVNELSSNSLSDSDTMKSIFQDYLVDEFADDTSSSYLFTPHTNATSFTGNSVFTSGHDTPSINLAEIDQFLSSTSATLGDQDFNLFGDYKITTDEWNTNPLFTGPNEVTEDPVSTYAFFKDSAATVTTASPHQFSLSTIGTDVEQLTVPSPKKSVKVEPILPSPELSPPTTRRISNPRRQSSKATPAARRISGGNSNAPFTPITPAPTTPSTPQPVVSFCTKRRIPIVDEDPAIVEKRRRNTVAAQRSRARKAEEKMEDLKKIAQLEREAENLRVLLSYWKDRACELGASPMEDGDN